MLRSRIAPTPSGFLHVGNAVNFALTWLLVRKESGNLRLRIDDLDVNRVREEYLEDIFETLDWLRINWDEGPQGVDEQAKYSQHNRLETYRGLIHRLTETGKVFACTCSRKSLANDSIDGQYPGTCRFKGLDFDLPESSLRIITPTTPIEVTDIYAGILQVDLNSEMRDFVIKRREGLPAYQVASLADDIAYNINLIVRGFDLLPSTGAQLYLSSVLGRTAFSNVIFYHHPIIKDEKGAKFSKSAGSLAIKSVRSRYSKPERFYQWLSACLGWKEVAGSAEEMLNYSKQGLPLRLKDKVQTSGLL